MLRDVIPFTLQSSVTYTIRHTAGRIRTSKGLSSVFRKMLNLWHLDHPHRERHPSPGGDGWRFSPRSGVLGNILHFPVAPHPRHIQRDPGATPSAWAHASQLLVPSL
jgi:hypothetical protein